MRPLAICQWLPPPVGPYKSRTSEERQKLLNCSQHTVEVPRQNLFLVHTWECPTMRGLLPLGQPSHNNYNYRERGSMFGHTTANLRAASILPLTSMTGLAAASESAQSSCTSGPGCEATPTTEWGPCVPRKGQPQWSSRMIAAQTFPPQSPQRHCQRHGSRRRPWWVTISATSAANGSTLERDLLKTEQNTFG